MKIRITRKQFWNAYDKLNLFKDDLIIVEGEPVLDKQVEKNLKCESEKCARLNHGEPPAPELPREIGKEVMYAKEYAETINQIIRFLEARFPY